MIRNKHLNYGTNLSTLHMLGHMMYMVYGFFCFSQITVINTSICCDWSGNKTLSVANNISEEHDPWSHRDIKLWSTWFTYLRLGHVSNHLIPLPVTQYTRLSWTHHFSVLLQGPPETIHKVLNSLLNNLWITRAEYEGQYGDIMPARLVLGLQSAIVCDDHLLCYI